MHLTLHLANPRQRCAVSSMTRNTSFRGFVTVAALYAEARLQVRRRRRKKVPLADPQPLMRPYARNEVWSADFVFDRTAERRVLKMPDDCR